MGRAGVPDSPGPSQEANAPRAAGPDPRVGDLRTLQQRHHRSLQPVRRGHHVVVRAREDGGREDWIPVLRACDFPGRPSKIRRSGAGNRPMRDSITSRV